MNEVSLTAKELQSMARTLVSVKYFSYNELKDVLIAKTAYTSGFDVELESDSAPPRIGLLLNGRVIQYFYGGWTDFIS